MLGYKIKTSLSIGNITYFEVGNITYTELLKSYGKTAASICWLSIQRKTIFVKLKRAKFEKTPGFEILFAEVNKLDNVSQTVHEVDLKNQWGDVNWAEIPHASG